MTRELAGRAVVALAWRTAAVGAEKLVFVVRLLVLARLLVPEDFGIVAIGMTVLAISLSLTEFGVVAALIHTPAPDRRHLDTAWTIGWLRGAGVTAVLVAGAPWIAAAFDEPGATDIVRVLALTALIQASASIEVARLNRELRFRELAGIRLSAAIFNTVVAIALAATQGAWAIVWGALAGALGQMAMSYVVAPYSPRFRLSGRATVTIVRFGRWMFLIGVLSVVSEGLLRWLTATQLGVADLGRFFMAVRLAFLPSQLVTEIVNEVAFPLYAELQGEREKAAAAFRKLVIAVASLLVPACFVFAWLVPDLVLHVLGERWSGSVAVMQLLILSSVVGLIGECMAPVLKGTGHPAGVAAMNALQLSIIMMAGLPLIAAFGLAGAGAAWLLAAAVSQVSAVHYARRLFMRPFAGLGVPGAAVLATSAVAVASAWLTSAALPGVAGLAGALVVSATAAAAVMLVLDRQLELGIVRTITQPLPGLRWLPGGGSRTR